MAKLTHTVSGNVASFRSADKTNIESLKVHFLPVQEGSGDPSPSNVRPIIGWNGCNLFKTKSIWDGQYELGYLNSSGEEVSGTSNFRNVGYIPVEPNSKIKIQYVRTSAYSANIRLYRYGSDFSYIENIWVGPGTTINLNAACYIRFYMDVAFTSAHRTNKTLIIDYEDNFETLPLSWSSHGVEYGGYIDITKGKLIATYEQLILDGSSDESWNKTAMTSVNRFFASPQSLGGHPAKNSSTSNLKTNYFISNASALEWYAFIGSTGNFLTYVPQSIETVNDWREYLANHNLQICYELAEPIEYDLTPQEIRTFLNYNNFWSDTNSITEVAYEVIDHLAVRRAKIPRNKRRVVWNQINPPLDSTNWKDYGSMGYASTTFNEGVAQHTYLVDEKGYYSVSICQKVTPNVIAGHIYYTSYMIRTDHERRCGIEFANNRYFANAYTIPADTWCRCSFLTQCNTTGYGSTYIPNPNPNDIYNGYTEQIKAPIYIDLTQMFGAGQEPTKDEFEVLCALNGINLEEYHAQDLNGTEQIWYINDNDKNIYQTVTWNQLARKTNLSNYEAYNSDNTLTENTDKNELTIQYNVIYPDYRNCIKDKSSGSSRYYKNHKYYAAYKFCPSYNTNRIGLSICNYASVYYPSANANEYTRMSYVLEKETNDGNHNILLAYPMNENNSSIGDTIKCKDVVVVDLTLMFGAGNEPTATEFEELCALNNVDINTYQPQNTGTQQIWRIK